MFRTTLFLIALCALVACDEPSRATSPARITVTDPTPARQTIRGILRRVVDDPVATGWALEAVGGEMYTLVGGPVESYESLLDREVFVVGIIDNGIITVDTLDARLSGGTVERWNGRAIER
jgi:hypothetical protein